MDKTVRNISIIALYDNEKKILLQLKDESHELYPSHWCFFGGDIEDGETPENALHREILEELDYKLNNPRKIMVYTFDLDSFSGNIHVFMEKYNNHYLLNLNEGKDFGWFDTDTALTLRLTPNTRNVLAYLIKNCSELR